MNKKLMNLTTYFRACVFCVNTKDCYIKSIILGVNYGKK